MLYKIIVLDDDDDFGFDNDDNDIAHDADEFT